MESGIKYDKNDLMNETSSSSSSNEDDLQASKQKDI